MNFDPTFLSNISQIVVAFSAGFVLALWLSLIFWTLRDIRTRSRDPLLRILASLIVAILFLPGIIIYLILRPVHTIEEEYQQSLEEEALLQSVEESSLCPGCSRKIHDDWMACPNCHTKLKKTCPHCNRLMELPWNLCPFCGTASPGMRRENQSLDEALRNLSTNPDETP